MKILITGATGFIGKALCRELLVKGHDLQVCARDLKKARQTLPYPMEFVQWDGVSPIEFKLDADAVIHLAGEPILGRRWDSEQKNKILNSRIKPIEILTATFQKSPKKPKIFISGSAIGFYGNRGDIVLTEESGASSGFLSEICQKWEEATYPLDALAIRRVNLRTGVVLGRGGGGMKAFIPLFKSGLGGSVGDGKQWMSWIHLKDMISAILFLLENERAYGPFNCVAPCPVTSREFSDSLGKILRKPSVMPAPAIMMKAAMGEMSDALLGSQRVLPKKLEDLGFKFQFRDLNEALKDICDVEQLPGQKEFLFEQWIPKTIPEIFPFFSEAENLGILTPEFLQFKIVSKPTTKIGKGSLIDYQMKIHGVPIQWRTRIEVWNPGVEFVDDQLKGPYKRWFHRHSFTAMKGGTLLTDRVLYQLPMGIFGQVAMGLKVRNDVRKIFEYRQKIISEKFGKTNKVE